MWIFLDMWLNEFTVFGVDFNEMLKEDLWYGNSNDIMFP